MGNFGEKSRFGDRLKKINLFKRKKYDNELEIEDSNKMYNNFIKVVAAIPLMVYENIIGDNNANDVNQDKKNVGVKDENNAILNNRKMREPFIFLIEGSCKIENHVIAYYKFRHF